MDPSIELKTEQVQAQSAFVQLSETQTACEDDLSASENYDDVQDLEHSGEDERGVTRQLEPRKDLHAWSLFLF